MKSLSLLLVLPLLSSVALAAKGDIERARFRPHLQELTRLFPPGRQNPQTVGERALTSGGRGATLSIQGLTRIYKKLDQEFDDLGDTTRELENSIGEVDKWTKILAAGRFPPAQRPAIEANIKAARDEYFARLVNDKWVRTDGGATFVQKFQQLIDTFNWHSDKDDREFVLDRVDDQVKKVRDTRYDMRVLQKGDGLHELRRELRWILIEIQSIAGLVAPEDRTACPIPQFAGNEVVRQIGQLDPNATRFLQFPAPARDVAPCMVTRCLLHGVVFLQARLGNIKDQAERILGSSESDLVPQQLLGPAFQTQQLMIGTNVLQLLHDQIKACK